MRLVGSRCLLTGLAGGALSLSLPSFAADAGADPAPPGKVAAIAVAVQQVFADREGDGERPERPAAALSSDALPLRLSQMIARPAAGRKPPLWTTRTEPAPQLKAARELALAGTAEGSGPGGEATELVGGLPVGKPGLGAFVGSGGGAASPSAPAAAGAAGSALGWEIPPIRWGGSVGYTYQHASSNSGYSSVTQGLFSNLVGSSYIYAPWFARVSGRLGVTTVSSTSSSSAADQTETSRSSNVVGGGEVNMFSSSRFPFRAYFDRSDSRASGTIVTNDYVSNRYGVSQNLRSEDGMSSGNFILDRNTISSSDGTRDDVTALSGAYSTTVGVVQNSLSGRYSLGERSGTGDRASLVGFNSYHTANISDTLNLGGVVNFTDSDIRTSSGLGESTSTRGRYLQLYTYGSWLPEFEDLDDLPLTLTGGLRYTNQETTFGSQSVNAQTMGSNVSALYRFSRNLSTFANGALTQIVQSQGQSQTLTQLGTGLNYTGDPLTFGKYSYNWSTGGNANWQSAIGETAANTLVSGQFNHALMRVIMLSPAQALSLNASQAVNVTNSQALGSSQSLTHTLSANLGVSAGERFSGSFSSMVSDVRTTGYVEQHYQVLNLGFYGQGQISQVSSATINMMFNWSDQSYQTTDAYGLPVNQSSQRMTLNGSAAYSHLRFAGVRGLRYNLIFAADSRLRDDRLYGNVNGEVDRARFMLTNRLEYRIGLLDFRLSLVNNDVGGKKNALLFFQVARQIGSY